MQTTYNELDPNRKSTRFVGYKFVYATVNKIQRILMWEHVTHAVTTVR
jgi:hypothetical protein